MMRLFIIARLSPLKEVSEKKVPVHKTASVPPFLGRASLDPLFSESEGDTDLGQVVGGGK